MRNEESQYSYKPLAQVNRNSTSVNIFRRYLLFTVVLMAIIAMLCINNIAMYKHYGNLKEQLEESLAELGDIMAGRETLIDINNKLIKDNESLKEENSVITSQYREIANQMQIIRKINEQLIEKNNELQEDNINLQNTLKKAASVGIKPQNYTNFEGISRSSVDRGVYIGRFLGTAYTPSKDECGNNKGITRSGEPIIPGLSIAIDNKYWPFGTVFYIKGLGYAVAMDTGGAIKGKYRFDFAVLDKNFAMKLGQDYYDVYLVKMGKGKVEDVKF